MTPKQRIAGLTLVTALVLAILGALYGATYAIDDWQGRQTHEPYVFVTVAASPGACGADYHDHAWHICDVVVPAPTEDMYVALYRDGAWQLVYCDPTVYADGTPAPCEG